MVHKALHGLISKFESLSSSYATLSPWLTIFKICGNKAVMGSEHLCSLFLSLSAPKQNETLNQCMSLDN